MMKKIKDNRGQAMAEFALILPVFLLLIGIIINITFISYGKMMTVISAWHGARAAVVCTSEAQAQSVAETKGEALSKEISMNGDSVTITSGLDGSSSWSEGAIFRVTATYRVDLPFPWISTNGLSDSYTVETTVLARVEGV